MVLRTHSRSLEEIPSIRGSLAKCLSINGDLAEGIVVKVTDQSIQTSQKAQRNERQPTVVTPNFGQDSHEINKLTENVRRRRKRMRRRLLTPWF
jgi:hypothetical protein